MRLRRATIGEQELKDPSDGLQQGVLQERSTNLFEMIHSALSKQNACITGKKSLAMKLKQAQREHCCIDIVNRRSVATSTTSKRASNIDNLKREISYLEREELKWDKFPKDNQENEPLQPPLKATTVPRGEFEMHFVNKLEQTCQPKAFRAFRNTFKLNNYCTNQQRSLTTNEKRAFRQLANQRKKSIKKYGTLQQDEQSQRSTISKSIHSHLAVHSPFRRYTPSSHNTRRNSSFTVDINRIEGRQFGTKKTFTIQETILD